MSWLPYLGFLVTITVLVSLLVALTLWQDRQQVRARATAATQNFAALLERQVSAVFDKADIVLRTAASQYAQQAAQGPVHADRFNRLLAEEQALLPEALSLRAAGADGVVRWGSGVPREAPVSIADRDYFRLARDSRNSALIVSGPVFARISQQSVIVLARRLQASDGSFAGVVYANVATSEFGKAMAIELGPNGAATLRTADLALVHRVPPPKDGVGTRNTSAELRAALQERPEGGSYIAVTPFDGVERSNAYRRLQKYPFYVIVGLATADYLGAWHDTAWTVAGLGLLVVLVTAIATGLIWRAARRQRAAIAGRERAASAVEALLLERTRLNAELALRVREAESANQAKGRFLASMSHEIRTPLHAVLGLAYLLEKSELGPEPRELVRKLHSAGRSLLGLINDILDYSKVEAGRLELEDVPFALGEVLDRVATVLGTMAAGKDIEPVIQPPPPGLEQLRGDALRLEQVLVNLVGNAVKFTERGLVEVALRLEVEEADRVLLRFSVRDTGIGIDAAQREAIFAPFAQADAGTTRRFGGTGLGLSISRRLVRLMGGDMGVDSTPGRGSEFWFTVRLVRGSRATAPVARDGAATRRVLVAAAPGALREAMLRSAALLGWKAHAVDDAAQAALAVARPRAADRGFDLVLLDVPAPGPEGLAAVRRLHEAAADAATVTGRAPALVLLARAAAVAALREVLLDGTGAVADAILTKPVTPAMLLAGVQPAAAPPPNPAATATTTAAAAPASADGTRLRGLRLLVVDDSAINREVAQGVFGGLGAQVALAADAEDALRRLRARPDAVDLVLMDVQMPGMDGYEAVREIRRDPALARLPVVALSAGALPAQREAATAAGMDGFIAKPFEVDAAVALILALARRAAAPVPDGRAAAVSAPLPAPTGAPAAAAGATARPGGSGGMGVAVAEASAGAQGTAVL
ncbi:hybrid sensor histidine kinase/response regulator, partial [Azohydromonas aeria]|uniref:hybrid sensor histidine kinase/response regulator n=1 Tax=Azohydromonas aeria TaxID=2590212 RepID=UPI0012FA1E12